MLVKCVVCGNHELILLISFFNRDDLPYVSPIITLTLSTSAGFIHSVDSCVPLHLTYVIIIQNRFQMTWSHHNNPLL